MTVNTISPSSETDNHLHTPLPTRSAKPRRPALKIPLPLNPWHPSPAPPDLIALIEDSLKSKPAPRRNQPDFLFTMTTSNPKAPPPTPTVGGPEEGWGTPLSEWSIDSSIRGPESDMLTPGTMTPRMSGESERRRSVRFEIGGVEVEPSEEREDGRESRTWKE
ncbi:hypothetical protein FH972_023047 [Carpinus fangiana]|uniref:Uncharacterized protein n=1 Tax=Carpinus fangiana TaxID=176857 RepID=A0A5N6KWB1_9ROSI|nr:hypothetical protein FH972_023047 [Carpinus fangiana]